MKALVHTKPYCFEYSDFPDPAVGDDDVLIEVKACGICGSDVHGCTGKTGRRIPPVIMGHEAAGVVSAKGKNVTAFQKGERVCFDSTIYCNKCPACVKGLYNRCRSRRVLGVSTADFKRHGAFAQFVSVPWWIVSKIPDNMSFVQAALLEPASIGLHAVNRAKVSAGNNVVVIGGGTIGLFIIQAAKLAGAAKIMVSDINQFRLDTAAKSGADVLINPASSDWKETVLKETQGQGADVVIEAVGYNATFQQAIAITKTGGCVTAVGNLEKTANFDLQELVSRELTFTGSYASSGEFRQCIDLVASGKINVAPLISEVVPMEMGQKAFDRLLKGEENLLKIVLEP